MVDYRRSLSAVRTDPFWKRKLALGVLIQLIPYVGTVWMLGWEMEYQRSVAWGDDSRIPEWSGFGRQAMLGLKTLVALLPYSLALSIILIPASMGTGLLIASAANAGAAPEWPAVAAFVAGTVALPFAVALLLLPVTGSVMLRVALFGTFESGFQFKEILRLMREGKAELLKAWGYSALNTLISLGAMVVYFGVVAVVMIALPGEWEQKLLAVLLLGTVAYVVYIALALALSLYLGLVNMHLFASYGRAAYRLDEQRESVLGGPVGASV